MGCCDRVHLRGKRGDLRLLRRILIRRALLGGFDQALHAGYAVLAADDDECFLIRQRGDDRFQKRRRATAPDASGPSGEILLQLSQVLRAFHEADQSLFVREQVRCGNRARLHGRRGGCGCLAADAPDVARYVAFFFDDFHGQLALAEKLDGLGQLLQLHIPNFKGGQLDILGRGTHHDVVPRESDCQARAQRLGASIIVLVAESQTVEERAGRRAGGERRIERDAVDDEHRRVRRGLAVGRDVHRGIRELVAVVLEHNGSGVVPANFHRLWDGVIRVRLLSWSKTEFQLVVVAGNDFHVHHLRVVLLLHRERIADTRVRHEHEHIRIVVRKMVEPGPTRPVAACGFGGHELQPHRVRLRLRIFLLRRRFRRGRLSAQVGREQQRGGGEQARRAKLARGRAEEPGFRGFGIGNDGVHVTGRCDVKFAVVSRRRGRRSSIWKRRSHPPSPHNFFFRGWSRLISICSS